MVNHRPNMNAFQLQREVDDVIRKRAVNNRSIKTSAKRMQAADRAQFYDLAFQKISHPVSLAAFLLDIKSGRIENVLLGARTNMHCHDTAARSMRSLSRICRNASLAGIA